MFAVFAMWPSRRSADRRMHVREHAVSTTANADVTSLISISVIVGAGAARAAQSGIAATPSSSIARRVHPLRDAVIKALWKGSSRAVEWYDWRLPKLEPKEWANALP